MIKFRDLICFLVVLGLVFSGMLYLEQLPWQSDDDIDLTIHRSDSRRHVTVGLNEHWTSFQIPADSDSVRLLSNAILESSSAVRQQPTLTNPRQGFRYAIEYEFLDENSNSIRRDTYHFRSKFREKLDRVTGEVIHPLRLADSDNLVAQTRVMQVSLNAELADARVLRVRTYQSNNEVGGILARTLCRSIRKDHGRFGEWDRISEPRKELLAKHSVYDHSMLDQRSRENLLKWQWLKATPLGEFEHHYLYLIGDSDDPAIEDKPFPPGSVVFPGWKVVVPTKNCYVDIRVEATPLEEGSSISGQLQYTFIDPQTRQPIHGICPLDSNSHSNSKSVTIENVIGLVEFQTESPVALRFWSRDVNSDDEWTQIELEPKQSITFVADERPVSFSVSHYRDEVTPVKATFRFVDDRLFATSNHETSLRRTKNVNWRYVDEKGKTLDEGRLELSLSVSAHERIWKDRNTFSLTNPESRWFPVPSRAKTVQFWNDESPFLVNAYTRPNGLSSHTRVPEDYDVAQKSESPYRRWFVIKPENYNKYISENRMLSIRVQPRLPEIAECDERTGLTWTQYVPEGDWIAARLLVPAIDPLESSSNLKLPDSEWLWHEFETGRSTSYSVVDRTSHYKNILLAFASAGKPSSIKLWCNEQLVVDREFVSTRGEFEVKLPDPTGKIRIESEEGVRVFASGIAVDSKNAFFRRTAMRIGSRPTSFDYEKKSWEDEHLTLTFYRDVKERNRADVSAKIVPLTATQDSHEPRTMWTIRNRRYDLSPMPFTNSVLMDRPGSIDSGSRCFIKLGSDMPPGKYRIEVEREDSDHGYLLLHQTTRELQTVRRVGIFDNSEIPQHESFRN